MTIQEDILYASSTVFDNTAVGNHGPIVGGDFPLPLWDLSSRNQMMGYYPYASKQSLATSLSNGNTDINANADASANVDMTLDFQDYLSFDFDFDLGTSSLPSIPGLNQSQSTSAHSAATSVLPVVDPGSQPPQPQLGVHMPAPPAATVQPRRHHCQHCMKTFRRHTDRDRHALVHNPNARRFSCPHPGCPRVGQHGFLRQDKLTQHRRHMNH